MPCLDTNFNISFISEDNFEASFYPTNASEFIDYLVEINSEVFQYIISEDFQPSYEIVEFLQEAVLAYLEETRLYPELSQFLETAIIDGISITIEEGEDVDEDILETLSTMDLPIINTVSSLIEESKYHKVVRGGKIINKKICPPGYRSTGNTCVRMGTSEVRSRMKAALKAAKTRRKKLKNSIFKQMLLKKRARSMKLGNSRGLY